MTKLQAVGLQQRGSAALLLQTGASELRTALAVTLVQANAASPCISSSEGDVGEEHDQVAESLKLLWDSVLQCE